MEVKLFEIRDKATFIPAMAIRLFANVDSPDFYLLRRAGYAEHEILNVDAAMPYVILTKLDGIEAHYDRFEWKNGRTMQIAHGHVIDNWNRIKSGDVIDVEFILGETQTSKTSERV